MLKILGLLLVAFFASPAFTYVGPGAGISVLGSLLGILATIVVAISAIIFWPVRKFLKRRKTRAESPATADADNSGTDS